ncbi:6091_t:CDS:1, partial [Gigaspora rosea]
GVIANGKMEGSTIHTAQSTSEESVKIAGSASSLFGDSTQSPFDSLFSPTNDSNTTDLNITESHPAPQTNDGSGQDYSQYYYPQQYHYDPSQQYVPSTYDSSSG